MRWLRPVDSLLGERIELLSPLTAGECAERLRTAAAGRQPEGLVGWIWGNWFSLPPLSGIGVIAMRNSFKTVATGRLIPDGASTRIRCRLGPHPFVIIFMAVWLGFVGSAAIAFAFGTGRPSVRGAPAALAPAIPALMLVAGTAVFALGRFAASGQREILVSALTNRLEARPVEVPAAMS